MKRIGFALAMVAFGALAGCQTAVTGGTPVDSNSIAERVAEEYKLGAGDRLRVTVFGEPNLSGEYVLDGTGMVSLPLVGEVGALDMTVREFQRAAEAAYGNGYLREPRINAEVMNYRPFYILGEVRAPGEYPYTNDLTVLKAVATAGGFTYRANETVILIKGSDDEQEYRVKLDATTKVLPGDTIRVIERFF